MAFFTGKGDNGTTNTFGAPQKISKSSAIAEALGSLDEVNSFLGFCRAKTDPAFKVENQQIKELVHQVQKDLFIVQAEVAGAGKTVPPEKVREMEKVIIQVEKMLPPIKTFFIPGGNEVSAMYDVSRTLARRAERKVIGAIEKEEAKISDDTKAFLNRLSSLLYAFARLINHLSDIKEEAPTYE